METNGDFTSWTVCTNCGHPSQTDICVNPILPTSSSMERLLKFTDIISASEAAHARMAIEQAKLGMEKIDEEIGVLESALARLRSNREVLQKRSQHLEAVLAPVRRLPTDVLIQIFHSFTTLEISVDRKKAALLSLCHVSRFWREVALSTSSFWTHISVCFPDNDHDMESQAAAVQHWLTYSRDSPLYVVISGADGLSLPDNHALEILVLQSHRWKKASLVVTLNEMSHYFRGVKGRLGKLESLSIYLKEAWMTIDYFEDAPSLRTFTMTGLITSQNPYPVRLPWDSLTHLKTESESVLAILKQCSSLGCCDLTIWNFWEQPLPNFVELPHLRSLTVTEGTGDPPGWFYDSLSFPLLQTFGLYSYWGTTSHHIASFLSRSSHTLERLLLSIHPSFNITACLEVTPRLKHLTIKSTKGNSLMSVSLRRLSLDLISSGNTLLPELESIEFEVAYLHHDISSVLDDAFIAMILSRLSCKAGVESITAQSQCSGTHSRLRSVAIVFNLGLGNCFEDPFQNEDILKFSRICQEGGVDVAVSKTDRGHWRIHMT